MLYIFDAMKTNEIAKGELRTNKVRKRSIKSQGTEVSRGLVEKEEQLQKSTKTSLNVCKHIPGLPENRQVGKVVSVTL